MPALTRRCLLGGLAAGAALPLAGCMPGVSYVASVVWTLLSEAAGDAARKVAIGLLGERIANPLIGAAEASGLAEIARLARIDDETLVGTARAIGVEATLDAIAGRGPPVWYSLNRTPERVNNYRFWIRNQTPSPVRGAFVLTVEDRASGRLEHRDAEIRFVVNPGMQIDLQRDVTSRLAPGRKRIRVVTPGGDLLVESPVLVASAEVVPRRG